VLCSHRSQVLLGSRRSQLLLGSRRSQVLLGSHRSPPVWVCPRDEAVWGGSRWLWSLKSPSCPASGKSVSSILVPWEETFPFGRLL